MVSPLLPEKTQDAHFVKEKRLGAVCADRVEIWKASIEESGQPCAVKFMPKRKNEKKRKDEERESKTWEASTPKPRQKNK